MKSPEDEAFEEIERIQRTRTKWVPVNKPQNEIFALGIQAGLCDEFGGINMEYNYKDQILAFAKLIAAKERERIFGELLRMHEIASSRHNYYLHAVVTIRARGQA
jgi:hypothetical protein